MSEIPLDGHPSVQDENESSTIAAGIKPVAILKCFINLSVISLFIVPAIQGRAFFRMQK